MTTRGQTVSTPSKCDVRQFVADIDRELRSQGTPDRAMHEKAYLKSELDHYGTTVPAIRSVSKNISARYPGLCHDELIAVASTLWAVPVHERRMAAVELLELHAELLRPRDVPLLERFLRESRTWALVDGIAASVVGKLVSRYPELCATIDRWAVDDDFWIRRSALLALLGGLRAGEGDFARFSRYADAMLDEKEFFIRKAIGWVLRETAKRRPQLVFDWLLPRAAQVSGVTLREAVKPLSDDQRAAVLAARSAKPASLAPTGGAVTIDIDTAVRTALTRISPEADLDALPGDAGLQEELDLDSMDFLNFLIALSELTGVEIPESDSSQVRTFADCAAYVHARVASKQ